MITHKIIKVNRLLNIVYAAVFGVVTKKAVEMNTTAFLIIIQRRSYRGRIMCQPELLWDDIHCNREEA